MAMARFSSGIWTARLAGAGLLFGLFSACSLINAPGELQPLKTTGVGGAGGAGTGGTGGAGGAPAVCGNGILEAGEECDDQNMDMDDACSPQCTITEFNIEADPSVGNEWPGVGLSGVDNGRGFFVIWRFLGVNANEIRGRAYKANGARVTQPPIKLSTTDQPDQARIGTNAEGRALVAWRSFADSNSVHYRVVEPDGTALGASDEVLANSQSNALVSVSSNSDGYLCLMWMREGDPVDPADEAVIRCFDPQGSSASTITQVLGTTNAFGYPGIWGIQGGFVGSWNSDDGKLSSMAVDSLGVPMGNVFSLAANANQNKNPFGAYVGPASEFIAVFEQDIDLNGQVKPRITKRKFEAPGMSQEIEALVSTEHSTQSQSRVAHHENGRFVIAWTDVDDASQESCNIAARVFEPNGMPLGDRIIINQKRPGCQSWPGVAVNADGDAMFVWDNNPGNVPFHISALIIPRLLTKP